MIAIFWFLFSVSHHSSEQCKASLNVGFFVKEKKSTKTKSCMICFVSFLFVVRGEGEGVRVGPWTAKEWRYPGAWRFLKLDAVFLDKTKDKRFHF